jgi:hypothetical protein
MLDLLAGVALEKKTIGIRATRPGEIGEASRAPGHADSA